jgi:hypothetical protein
MAEESRIERFARTTARNAGRRYAEFSRAYRDGKRATADGEDARIVCRRYAEKRTVALSNDRPDCFDPDHPDCRGCVEDIREGTIETW